MDPGSLFIFLILIGVIAGIGFALFNVGASQWKKQTDSSEGKRPPEEQARPTHKVLDKQGNLIGTDYSKDPHADDQ